MKRGVICREGESNTLLAPVWRAQGPLERMRGLLGRPPLAAAEGLFLSPCGSVHTVGMRYAIDLAFLDRRGTVVRTVTALPPWRMCMARGARDTLELAAGTLDRLGVRSGDRLVWMEQ